MTDLSKQAQQAVDDCLAFVNDSPTFAATEENLEVLTNFMIKNDLKPTRANFKKAWDELRARPDAVPQESPESDADADAARDKLDRMVEAMSGEEFKQRINSDKEFRDAVNAPRKKKS